MSGVTLTTVGGWATVLAVAGGIYWISGRKERSRRPPTAKQSFKASDSKKDTKGKKGKKAVVLSDGESESKSGPDKRHKNKNKKTSSPAAPEEPSYTPSTKDDRDEEADNREFAKQMSKAKTGAIAAPKSKTETRQKSVKQSKAQEKHVETSSDNYTAPSSANGGDADDDQSSVSSPNLSATTVESPLINGGISDMLEKSAPGPSILNITTPTTSEMPHTNKKKKKAEAPPPETKKQRQNRQKAETKKAQRAAEEAERQKLLEAQRRTARLAEGRAAKDGSTFTNATNAPTTSSWVSPPAINGTGASSTSVDLLDTTETATPTRPAAKASSEVGSSSTTTTSFQPDERVYSLSEEFGSQFEDLPSEEEQMRIIAENENWETVKSKEAKNKERKAALKGQQKENAKPVAKPAGSSDEQDEQQEYGVPPKRAPARPGQVYTTVLTHVDSDGEVHERTVDLQDDEWEVS